MNAVPKYDGAGVNIVVIPARFVPVVDIVTMEMSCYARELNRN
jgi:hypothetical protein